MMEELLFVILKWNQVNDCNSNWETVFITLNPYATFGPEERDCILHQWGK